MVNESHIVHKYKLTNALTLYDLSKHCFNFNCNCSTDCCMRPHTCYHDGAALVTEWGGDMDWRGSTVWVTERLWAVCLLSHTQPHQVLVSHWSAICVTSPDGVKNFTDWCSSLASHIINVTRWREELHRLVQVFSSHMRSEKHTGDWSSQQCRPWPLFSCVYRCPPLPTPSATCTTLILVTSNTNVQFLLNRQLL